jgi:universal stress protein E
MRIVSATDLLPKSEAAIDRASLLADQLGADLTLLHVVAPSESERVTEQTRQIARERLKSRAQLPLWRGERAPDVQVRAGNAARTILDTVARSRAQLLVLGPHRKRRVRDAFANSIVESALAARNCPVLIVQDEAEERYGRVLLALDLSAASGSAIRAAESLVVVPDVDATVVHAYEPPYQGMLHYAGVEPDMATRYAESWKRDARSAVRDLLERESSRSPWYDIVVEQQPAAVGILRAIERFDPDLLVMGTHGGGRLRRAFVGSVAKRMLQEISCDVLIVPDGSFGAARTGHSRLTRRMLEPRPD